MPSGRTKGTYLKTICKNGHDYTKYRIRHKNGSTGCLLCKRHLKRKSWLKTRYGLTFEQVNILLEKQDHACKICQAKDKTLNIDHCHKTGKIRWLLCLSCNTALGNFKDNIELLREAIKYLEEHNETN